MVELSTRTANHVRALFAGDQVADVVRLLTENCAETLPIVGPGATPSTLERIRFAALRLSAGDMDRLRYAVELANTDWRDLLVGALFADDIHAHQKWTPRPLDAATSDAWKKRLLPEGVEFGPNDVVVWPGEQGGPHGNVMALVRLEPEPRYLVRWSTGRETEMWQRQLRGAG
jgi:hypothetical protein